MIREAGVIALAIHERDFTAEEKADKSPVTEADRRLNEILVRELSAAFPGDLVIGEESGFDGVPDAERAWFVDPVDGTSDFIKKNGEWSVMIGHAQRGEAVVGVVYEPVRGTLYYAERGAGAWREHGGEATRLEVGKDPDPTQAVTVRSRSHPDPRIDAVLDRLGVTRDYRHGSVGCKLAQIAEGRADIYFNFSGRCFMWDTCGPEVIIREAGGDLVDFDGKRISYKAESLGIEVPFVAVAGALQPAVLSVLREMRDQLLPEP